ncbi:MAG: hypothetical protein KatS3mg002_0642 [Candidatus Woesearchaeota archaeon]|nr:MAG: hypothetical protein KatS3mg002_0642 [Candidatus Woesearchaeota archaeon]
MKEKEIKEHIEKGYILCRVIFEMVGNPKEHVETTLKKYISAIKEDPSYIFMNEYFAPAEEKDGLWSTFFESEVLVLNFEKLNILCFNLTPASIEIIEPEDFKLKNKDLTYWYNDLLSKLHEISISLKNQNSENTLLKVNLGRAIRNSIILALNEPRTIEEISAKVGIDKEQLQPFIESLKKEKVLVFEENKYIKV